MHTRKRTAILVATVGALLIGGTAGAEAAEGDPSHRSAPNDGGRQTNRCDTSSVIGGVTLAVSDIKTETNCVNYSESGVREQKNRCRTHSVIGPVTVSLTGADVTQRTNCVNVSKSGKVTKQTNKCDTTSVIGPITIAPGSEVIQETQCTNVAGTSSGQGGRGTP